MAEAEKTTPPRQPPTITPTPPPKPAPPAPVSRPVRPPPATSNLLENLQHVSIYDPNKEFRPELREITEEEFEKMITPTLEQEYNNLMSRILEHNDIWYSPFKIDNPLWEAQLENATLFADKKGFLVPESFRAKKKKSNIFAGLNLNDLSRRPKVPNYERSFSFEIRGPVEGYGVLRDDNINELDDGLTPPIEIKA